MNQSEDREFDERVQQVIQQGKDLVDEAEGRISELEQLYKRIELDPADCSRFLKGDRLTPEQKHAAQKEIDALKEELERDRLAARSAAESQRAPRMSSNRVRI